MEITYEQWKAVKKDLRRKFSTIGWILLGYYGIMNAAVFLAVFAQIIINMIAQFSVGNFDSMFEIMVSALNSAWGYFLAAAVGLTVLLCWKKPRFWKAEIWAKGKPMKAGDFFAVLCIFLSGQMIYQIFTMILEFVLNAFGLSVVEGMNELAMNTDTFSMFLYAGVLAPVTEEILFRGLIQRTLLPYGRKFAIFCSAFTFGIFHGNLMQSPYAFLVGLVLGYVASEYSIAWAMLLHMINNLVVADVLTRLTSGLPEQTAGMIILTIIALFTVAAIVILIVKRRQIRDYIRNERINRTYLRCFFSCAGMIVLMALMGINILYTLILMIRPI